MAVDSTAQADSRENAAGPSLVMVGGGRMGEAIVAGLIASRTMAPSAMTVVEPDERRRDELQASHGIRTTASGLDEIGVAEIVILAVKPQVIEGVVRDLADALAGTAVVSVAAGITTARLESLLPAGTVVVRVMPNTPALVGEGMALISGGSEATAEHVEAVRALFASIGGALVIDERYQDAGTAISGSGPAYFALVVDALARAGVSQGLTRDVAQALAIQTMLGTAVMLRDTGIHPAELMDGVASPGGTTIAALGALESGGVRASFDAAVAAAVRRSRELGS